MNTRKMLRDLQKRNSLATKVIDEIIVECKKVAMEGAEDYCEYFFPDENHELGVTGASEVYEELRTTHGLDVDYYFKESESEDEIEGWKFRVSWE